MSLKGKQKDFADYLLQDPEQNATAAYLKAYPKSNPDSARANAARLLATDSIQAYLDSAKAERSKRTQIDADWLLTRLADESEADIADLFDEHTGALLPVRKWPKIFRQGLVAGIDVSNTKSEGDNVSEIVKIKLADRNAKLKMIGDHIGVQAFKQQVQHSGSIETTVDPKTMTDEQLAAIIAQAENGGAKG